MKPDFSKMWVTAVDKYEACKSVSLTPEGQHEVIAEYAYIQALKAARDIADNYGAAQASQGIAAHLKEVREP